MGKGGGGSSTTNTVSTPWTGQQPYLSDVFSQAQTLYNNGDYGNQFDTAMNTLAPAYYQGQTVADQSDNTVAAQNIQAQRALAGDDKYGNIANAAGALTNTLQDTSQSNNTGLGQLNNFSQYNINGGNTGLQTLNAMSSAVNPYSMTLLNQGIANQNAQLDSQYSSAGRYGSGAHENAKASAATDLSNQFLSNAYDQQMNAASQAGSLYNTGWGNQIAAANDAAGAYNTGVANQTSAAAQAQQLAQQPYTDAAALSEVGAAQDNYQQALIDAQIDRYNYNAQRPLSALSNYNQLIQGTYGGTTTNTGKQGYQSNALGTAIGGTAAAASLYSSLSGGKGLTDLFSSTGS